MKRTQEALGNLVNYELITKIRPLEPPIVEKGDIPKFILCQNYEKAMQKVERTMERYNRKVNELRARLQQSEAEIEAMQKTYREVHPGKGYFVNEKNPDAVHRYNSRLRQAQGIADKISDTSDKHEDLIERHNDAVREAEEKLEELTEEAKLVIDEDLVVVLDKCAQTTQKLADSENSEDLVASLEVGFIGMKIFKSFEEHIEGATARRETRDRIGEIDDSFAELCANEDARNYFVDIFRRNLYLVEKNAELYDQVVEVVGSVDQAKLDEMTQPYRPAFEKKFNTSFKYEGIVSPSELSGVVSQINKSIVTMNDSIAQVTELNASTQVGAESGVKVHQDAESIFATMKNNVEEIRDDLLHTGNFECDLVDEEVIEDFYSRDLRPAVVAFREHLVGEIEEEQLDRLVMADEDRYSIGKAEAAIKQADLLRLQAQRNQVDGHVKKLNGMIKDAETDIQKSGEVPRKNAEAFRSGVSTQYILSLFPVIGFAFAMGILGRIKKFAQGFMSTNEIYRKLGTETIAKNKTMQMVNLILGVVLGLGGIGLFFGTSIGADIAASMSVSPMAVNIGIPGVVLVLYLITWAILGSAGKTLQSYIASSKTAKTATTQ